MVQVIIVVVKGEWCKRQMLNTSSKRTLLHDGNQKYCIVE